MGYSISTVPSIPLNWIGQLIRILVEGIGIVGVGIIVFTLILKCIVLPLDIYSRVAGKKQSLIMERMRPQMEKLQQQYANDKSMYNQKVVELQKKSGYSMLSSCLPIIVSIVIFIIVLQAFSAYSQYANLESYNDLVNAYNGVVNSYIIDEDNPQSYGFLIPVDEDGNPIEGDDIKPADFEVKFDKFAAHYNHEKKQAGEEISEDEVFTELAQDYKQHRGEYESAFDISAANSKQADGVTLTDTARAIRVSLINYYLEEPAAQAAREYYMENNNSFLWVRNLWYPDSSFTKEMPTFENFKRAVSNAHIGDDYATSYEKVTAALGDRKSAVNGYFIFIILSIGLMLVQQIISMRANKAMNDLSTVDGTAARTNKMMLILMPIIYGVFAFMYSAAFSLYMITSTLFGLATMLTINKLVDVWFKKKEASGELDAYLNRKANKNAKKANRNAGRAQRSADAKNKRR